MAVAAAPFRTRLKVTGVKSGIYADAFTAGSSGSPPAYVAGAGGYRAANWWPAALGPNAALSYSLQTIRSRSLHADRNTPFVGGAHDRIAAETVGTGIKPQSMCPDLPTREKINRLFQDWTDESDADGMLDFYGQQWMTARSAAAQGEMFARFRVRRPGDMKTVPLQIQMLEADFVPLDYTRAAAAPLNTIRDGIETNAVGARVAYWMYRFHPGDASVVPASLASSEPIRVPASEVAHVYLPTRIGQMRGVPWIARSLVPIRDMADAMDANRVRQKTAAMFMAAIESKADAADTALASETGTVEGDDDVLTMEPGTVVRLPDGQSMKFSTPPEVGTTFEPFFRLGYREVAAGLGLLYEQLTGDYSNLNDRTLRAALHGFRRVCHVWQHHMMVYQYCRQVWSRWLPLAELAGLVARPAGMPDADFHRVVWVPEAWPYIHPVQDVEAKVREVNAGFTTRSAVVSEAGEDSELVDATQATDNARADRLGLKYTSDGRTATAKAGAAPPAQESGQTEEQEEKADA